MKLLAAIALMSVFLLSTITEAASFRKSPLRRSHIIYYDDYYDDFDDDSDGNGRAVKSVDNELTEERKHDETRQERRPAAADPEEASKIFNLPASLTNSLVFLKFKNFFLPSFLLRKQSEKPSVEDEPPIVSIAPYGGYPSYSPYSYPTYSYQTYGYPMYQPAYTYPAYNYNYNPYPQYVAQQPQHPEPQQPQNPEPSQSQNSEPPQPHNPEPPQPQNAEPQELQNLQAEEEQSAVQEEELPPEEEEDNLDTETVSELAADEETFSDVEPTADEEPQIEVGDFNTDLSVDPNVGAKTDIPVPVLPHTQAPAVSTSFVRLPQTPTNFYFPRPEPVSHVRRRPLRWHTNNFQQFVPFHYNSG